MPFTPSLDHIIILIPQATLNSLPSTITSSFKIYPGGTHADNKTKNCLVLLKSGVYLEFISFINDDPTKKEGHWWGKKIPGTIIDFALTSKHVSDIEGVRKALATDEEEKLNMGYLDSNSGGRKRPDGMSVKWTVTFPTPSVERGTAPFWCHDITPRELRVPIQSVEEATKHPSLATGVSKFILVVSPGKWGELSRIYTKILGNEGVEGVNGELSFEISQPISGSTLSSVVLRKGETEEEKAVVEKSGGVAGIWEVVLTVEGDVPSPIREKIGEGVIKIDFEKI